MSKEKYQYLSIVTCDILSRVCVVELSTYYLFLYSKTQLDLKRTIV